MMLPFFYRISVLLGTNQEAGFQVEGVEDHYPLDRTTTSAAALDLQYVVAKFAVHGPAAPKLDHVKLPASP
jgi:hypothetical protein